MNLQENIQRIKEMMGLNEQYPEGIDPKDLEAQEVPIDNVEPEETPNEKEPKDSDDFSNSVVPQIVWRAGRVSSSPKVVVSGLVRTKKMLKTLPGPLGMKEGRVCHNISTFKTQCIIKTSGMII